MKKKFKSVLSAGIMGALFRNKKAIILVSMLASEQQRSGTAVLKHYKVWILALLSQSCQKGHQKR